MFESFEFIFICMIKKKYIYRYAFEKYTCYFIIINNKKYIIMLLKKKIFFPLKSENTKMFLATIQKIILAEYANTYTLFSLICKISCILLTKSDVKQILLAVF